MISFEEDRKEQRYLAIGPLDATLGRVPLVLTDLGETGVHVRHATSLRPGTEAAFRIDLREHAIFICTPAFVVWSRFESPGTPHPYTSGLLVPDPVGELRAVIAKLLELGLLAPDGETVERHAPSAPLPRTPSQPSESSDRRATRAALPAGVVALVKEARRRLESSPREMSRWLERAHESIAEVGGRNGHPDAALAVWQYLEHAIDLDTIARLIEE